MLARSSFPAAGPLRSFSSLIYKEFGDPAKVLELSHSTEATSAGPSSSSSSSLLVKLVCAPVNPSDLNQIENVYPIKPVGGLPAVAGNEGLFELQEDGTGTAGVPLQRGQKALVLEAGYGTWSEERRFPSDLLLPVPPGVPDELACTLAVNGVSAYRMLEDFERIGEGDVVVQNGANSAVGQLVIQLARARGAKTVNVVRDRPQTELEQLTKHLKGLGADVVTTDGKIRDAIKGLPAPKLALNCVGGASTVTVSKVLAPGGTLVTYGGMSKEPVQVPTSLFIFKDIKAAGFWLSGSWHTRHGLQGRADTLQKLFQLAQEGRLAAPRADKVRLGDYLEGLKKGGAGGGPGPTGTVKTLLVPS